MQFGGRSYHWTGKNIRPLYREGYDCISLPRVNSIVYMPVSVKPDTEYEVVVNGCTAGGTSKCMLNFFANINFDGPHVCLVLDSVSFKNYKFIVKTPKFPQNLPINLRIFKTPQQTGGIFINTVKVNEVNTVPVIQSIAKTQQITSPLKNYKKIQNKITLTHLGMTKEEVIRESKVVYSEEKDQLPKISIITFDCNNIHDLTLYYYNLNNNSYYHNWEWVVGYKDIDDDVIQNCEILNDSRVKLIKKINDIDNTSQMHNRLLDYSDGQYILFMNNVIKVKPFWMYNLINKLKHNEDIGAVSPKILNKNESLYSCGILITENEVINVDKQYIDLQRHNDHEKYERFYQIVHPYCFMMRREDFINAGKLGENNNIHYDCMELCLNIKNKLNKKILFIPTSIINVDDVEKNSVYGQFKEKIYSKFEIDYDKYTANKDFNVFNVEVSFITCCNDPEQYIYNVFGSLLKNNTSYNYELIPILNLNNEYFAGQALNIGMRQAIGKTSVLLHQDIVMFQNWVSSYVEMIAQINKRDTNWGVIGTAGINEAGLTLGHVYSLHGDVQWSSNVNVYIAKIQTLDEHLMAVRNNSGLYFDEQIKGFHFYGVDLCLTALDNKMQVYGVNLPLVHNGRGGSLKSGKEEYLKLADYLIDKWKTKFSVIRTSTAIYANNIFRTFLSF